MIEIDRSLEAEALIGKVWAIVADLENEHRPWTEFRGVRILSRTESMVEREVMIRRGPLGEEKSLQTLAIDPDRRTTTLTMTRGPMLGTRKMTLTGVGKERTKICVGWKVEMKGVPGFAMGFARDGISGATEKALARIAEKAARGRP